MIKNYFKTAIRNLSRHKINAVINIAGLAVGFAAFLLIFLVVQYEQSFDAFHTKKDKIYRVVRVGNNPADPAYAAGLPLPVTPALRSELSHIANITGIADYNNVQVLIPGNNGIPVKKFKEESGMFFAEPQFFQMFDFGLAQGDIKTALNDPDAILLTKATAIKYFGDWVDVTGKIFKVGGHLVKVTGILNDTPANTDFPIKAVLPYTSFSKYMIRINALNWKSIDDGNYCFVQLADGNTLNSLNKSLVSFTNKFVKPIIPDYYLSLQPLNQMHYDGRYTNFNGHTFSKDLILALNLIGLFLLIVACVNFINLTIAQAINRSREVGVRKVLGGSRMQLIVQFLGETVITSFFALLIALLMVLFCLPSLNNLLGIHLVESTLYSSKLIFFMFCGLILVSLVSGLYPALMLSGFKPVSVLKGIGSIDQKQGVLFRRALVVFQFVIAQALILGTLVVTSQLDYFSKADMGFRKNAIVYASIPDDSLGHAKMDYIRNELLKVAGIENVSFSMYSPLSDQGGWNVQLNKDNNAATPDMAISAKIADPNFFSVYNLPIIAGRVYAASDTLREFVVSETVIKKLGIKNPDRAIGRMINVQGHTLPIVGVVKGFHINSLRDPIVPLVMSTAKNGYRMASIKINLSETKPVLAAMENIWNKNFPDYVFEYHFLDQTIANYYKQENQLSKLYTIFSGIAIFISCLGLYGLISFMAVQRKKEIGIRKVLGAPVKNIVMLLSKEFTMLVIIAFFIAAPLAWYFMHQWLQNYTFHINLGIWFFAATILSSISIAWLTVGYTAIKAALANPVKSLRTE